MMNKKAELAMSTLIIIIASLILISGFLYIYFNELDFLVSESYTNTKLSESQITRGFEIINVGASDGRDGYYSEFFIDARLLPDSDEISFDLMNILIKTGNWSAGLVYRNGTPVQNNSGFIGFVNGTGFFQKEYLITSDFHQTGRMIRGETARFYVHVPYPVYHDEQVSINLLPSNGVSYPVTVFTGDTIPGRDNVLLYPRI